MILSDKTIRELRIVTPCDERTTFRGKSYGLSHAGYYVRVDLVDLGHGVDRQLVDTPCAAVMTPDGAGIRLEPGQSVLVGVCEHFSMPADVVGYVKDKSTWSRLGLFTAQAVLEPGWRGYLSVRIVNLGDEGLTIVDREPIAQVVFHRLDGIPERSYSGKYQGQERGPQGPRFEE